MRSQFQIIERHVEQAEDGSKVHKTIVSASAGPRNRAMLKVDPRGVDLTSYQENPVVLWSHNPEIPPIGKATHVQTKGGKIHASFVFNQNDPLAVQLESAWENGFINAVSIGVNFNPSDIEETRQGLVLRKSDMLEFSLVSIPADRDALKQSYDLPDEVLSDPDEELDDEELEGPGEPEAEPPTEPEEPEAEPEFNPEPASEPEPEPESEPDSNAEVDSAEQEFMAALEQAWHSGQLAEITDTLATLLAELKSSV